MESYNKFSKIASIVLAIAVGLYLWIPSCNENSSDSDSESKSPSQLHYSWNNKFGDRVVVDLKPDGSGTIKLVDPKTSEEYGYGYSGKNPVPCYWKRYNFDIDHIQVTIPHQGKVYIQGGYVYTDEEHRKARNTSRAMRLN